MNVDETKRLILDRLEELRQHRPTAPGVPPRSHHRRRRRGGWLWGGGAPAVDRRISELDDRVSVLESLLVGGQRRPPANVTELHPPTDNHARPGTDNALDFGGRPYRLTGNADDGLMTDVLQMLASNQKTGLFSYFNGSPTQRFDVYFDDGEMVHAATGSLTGEAAFFALMSQAQESGHYGFIEGEAHKGPPSVEQKTQFLILEALRRIDEERRGPGQE